MPEGPEAGRGKDDPHPEALEGAQPCLHLDFRFRGSKTTKEQCLLFKSPSLRYFVTAVLENDTHHSSSRCSDVKERHDRLPSRNEFSVHLGHAAAAAAKSLQSCPTLCDPIDGSPPGSPVPGILQARTLEWVAISFSNA